MSALQPQNLSFGLSPCPNDTYIFHAMLHGLVPVPASITPHMADVEELNNLARQKSLDVTKMSLGATTEIMQDYALLSSGAALGWGCGPLVVARKNLKPEDWRNATVAVPGLLTTANLLLTLHGGFQGPRKEMLFSDIMPAVASGEADLGLIIHEGRFTYARQGLVKLLEGRAAVFGPEAIARARVALFPRVWSPGYTGTMTPGAGGLSCRTRFRVFAFSDLPAPGCGVGACGVRARTGSNGRSTYTLTSRCKWSVRVVLLLSYRPAPCPFREFLSTRPKCFLSFGPFGFSYRAVFWWPLGAGRRPEFRFSV